MSPGVGVMASRMLVGICRVKRLKFSSIGQERTSNHFTLAVDGFVLLSNFTAASA
jgi:hypothetical protein